MEPHQISAQTEHLLSAAGWAIQDHLEADPQKSLGVAVRDFPLARTYGKIDYLLFLEGKAAGLIELQDKDTRLTGVPLDREKYSRGLPFTLHLFTRPLPFLYQSRGAQTCFTNAFDPTPTPRHLIGFHRPETLRTWLEDGMVGETPRDMAAAYYPEHRRRGRSFQERIMINMPNLSTDGLSPEQHKAITNVETSLGENRGRALIEMATGKERAMLTIRLIERLLKFADARRVLVLVHSAGIAQELQAAIQKHLASDADIPFAQTFPVQHLTGNKIMPQTRLCIASLPHLHGLLADQETPTSETLLRYNAAFPIESFEVIILDPCDPSLIPDFRETLAYFDASLIGFMEKCTQETAVFFNQNLVMQYKDEKPKATTLSDGLNIISSETPR